MKREVGERRAGEPFDFAHDRQERKGRGWGLIGDWLSENRILCVLERVKIGPWGLFCGPQKKEKKTENNPKKSLQFSARGVYSIIERREDRIQVVI
ncbi:MAG: hypothetical protein ACYSSL_05045 [Planctomycetota bacterium]